MKLEDCTKEELILYIKSKRYDQRDYEFFILMHRADIASKLASKEREKAVCALKEYTEALEPYGGCSYMDIPDRVTL